MLQEQIQQIQQNIFHRITIIICDHQTKSPAPVRGWGMGGDGPPARARRRRARVRRRQPPPLTLPLPSPLTALPLLPLLLLLLLRYGKGRLPPADGRRAGVAAVAGGPAHVIGVMCVRCVCGDSRARRRA